MLPSMPELKTTSVYPQDLESGITAENCEFTQHLLYIKHESPLTKGTEYQELTTNQLFL